MLKVNETEIILYTDEFYHSSYWFTKTNWLKVKKYEFKTIQDDITKTYFIDVRHNEEEQIYLVNDNDCAFHIFKSPSYASKCVRACLSEQLGMINPLEDYPEPKENLLHVDFDSLSEEDKDRRLQIADEECS